MDVLINLIPKHPTAPSNNIKTPAASHIALKAVLGRPPKKYLEANKPFDAETCRRILPRNDIYSI